MKLFLRHTLALAAVLALASPTLSHASPQVPAPASSTPQGPLNGAMDARLFYEILVGEMSAQQGDYSSAYALFLDGARRTQSPQLFARAAGLALIAREGNAALTAAQAWRKADPTSRDAARLELQALVGMHRLAEAVEPIRAMIERSPEAEQAPAILALPVVFARTNDKDLAAQTVDHALQPFLQRANTKSAALVTTARLHLKAGHTARALAATEAAHQADPSFDAAAIMALELAEAGVDAAEPIITKFLAGQPAATLVRLHYAKLLMDAKRLDDAFTQLKTAIEHDPSFADAWLLMSDIHLQRKQTPEAEAALQQYLQRAQQSGPAGGTPRGINVAALQLAEMAMREQRKQDALMAMKHFVPNEANSKQLYRMAKLQLDTDQANAAWATLALLPEDNAEDLKQKQLAMAQLLREAQQPQKAYDTLTELLAEYPDDTDVLYDTALSAEQMGDLQAMERNLRRIIEIDPKHHNAYNALGYAFADRNVRLHEARQLIEKALQLSPESLHIQDSLAWLEYREGNHTKAQAMLETIYAEFPDAEIAAHLGEVLWTSNQRERAQSIWKEALQQEPNSTVLQNTIQRLTGSKP